jgi:hypothetical protein
MHPPQFTLGRLLFAVSCASVAIGLVVICIQVPSTLGIYIDDFALQLMLIQMAAPLIGGVAGVGLGSLWNRRMRGFLAGLILGLFAAYVEMMAINLHVILEHWI